MLSIWLFAKLNVQQATNTNNIIFDWPDLAVDFETDIGWVYVEAFKSVHNDLIISRNETSKFGQLTWVSIGYPSLVLTINARHGHKPVLFMMKPEGFDVMIDMLSNQYRQLFKAIVKRKYEIDVKAEQIVTLIPAKFECTIEFYSDTERILISGKVNQLNKFPLRLSFTAPLNSKERILFDKRAKDELNNLDLDIVCQIYSRGRSQQLKHLVVNEQQLSQMGFVKKIFENDEAKFVTRIQMTALFTELYQKLNIMRQFQISETQFKEAILDSFLAQTSTLIDQFVDIDAVLAELSDYNLNVELQPNVVKNDLKKLFQINNSSPFNSVVIVDLSQFDRMKLMPNKRSCIEILNLNKSVQFVLNRSGVWKRMNFSLNEQLIELNNYHENEIEWEIKDDVIRAKSVRVSKLNKANFNKRLTFDTINLELYESSYKQTIAMNTLNTLKFHSPDIVYENREKLIALEAIFNNSFNSLQQLDLKTNELNESMVSKLSSMRKENAQKMEIFSSNLNSEMSTLKSSLNSLITTNINRIVQGTVQFQQDPDLHKPNSEQTRQKIQRIEFGFSFRSLPEILLSFKTMDIQNGLRIDYWIDKKERDYFDLGVSTWKDTEIELVNVDWAAFGVV